jgi:hypothetical protein
MRPYLAGAIGGLIGGVVVSAVMIGGRQSGLLHKTLGEHTEDWMDRKMNARHLLGDAGTTVVEQINHLAASSAFGAGYGASLEALPHQAPLKSGAIFGAGLYTTAIGGIAPLLGITRGEHREPPAVVAQRLGLHVLFGVVTAYATDALMKVSTRRALQDRLPEKLRRIGAF